MSIVTDIKHLYDTLYIRHKLCISEVEIARLNNDKLTEMEYSVRALTLHDVLDAFKVIIDRENQRDKGWKAACDELKQVLNEQKSED